MDQLSGVMQSVAGALGPYVPRAVGALSILVIAWIVARLARAAIQRLEASARLDERMHSPGLSATLANVGYWLVWLIALPALLGTLELQGLLVPVSAMLTRTLSFIPNLLGSAIVFGIGFLMARIVRELIVGVLTAAGSEKLATRLGLASALGKNTLAGLVGAIVFALILLPTLVAALQPLGLDAVTNSVSRLLDAVMGLIPKLVSAAIIVVIAVLVGRALAGIVTGLLAGVGFNKVPEKLGLSGGFNAGGRDASELAGVIVMGAVAFVGVTQACEVLGFDVLTQTVAALGLLLAKLLVAAFVLAVGLWLGNMLALPIQGSAVAHAKTLSGIARAAVLFFAAALALLQAGLPGEIVTIAFASVVGAIAVGVAIAFGFGGRRVAGRLLESVVASFIGQKDSSPPEDRR
jgi:hypothetical protein